MLNGAAGGVIVALLAFNVCYLSKDIYCHFSFQSVNIKALLLIANKF